MSKNVLKITEKLLFSIETDIFFFQIIEITHDENGYD